MWLKLQVIFFFMLRIYIRLETAQQQRQPVAVQLDIG